MKNLKKLGKVLGKKEQKSVNGGIDSRCSKCTGYPYPSHWCATHCPWPEML